MLLHKKISKQLVCFATVTQTFELFQTPYHSARWHNRNRRITPATRYNQMCDAPSLYFCMQQQMLPLTRSFLALALPANPGCLLQLGCSIHRRDHALNTAKFLLFCFLSFCQFKLQSDRCIKPQLHVYISTTAFLAFQCILEGYKEFSVTVAHSPTFYIFPVPLKVT